MSKIPALKKVLPTSPDAIQRFSSEAEAAVARMAHLNRLALYVGSEIEIQDLDYNVAQTINVSKPCGTINITNFGTAAGDENTFDLIFDPLANGGADTIVFVQLTAANSTIPVAIRTGTLPFSGASVTVTVTNLHATTALEDFSVFYTIIPQLS